MRLLLDTHVLLWYLDGELLPKEVVKALEDAKNQRIVSIVSLWELSIKISLKKIQTSRTLSEIHDHLLSKINFEILNIEYLHLSTLLTIPHFHNDPFDRLLIAQAISENLTIISADRHFPEYSVDLIW